MSRFVGQSIFLTKPISRAPPQNFAVGHDGLGGAGHFPPQATASVTTFAHPNPTDGLQRNMRYQPSTSADTAGQIM